jgi:DMSO/TMAO reductase YedYZ molybdopterin-dependent catalytic subunit
MQTTPAPSRRRTLRHAAYGVLATVVGLAAAHLVAALTVPAASPVLAVGSTVIDLTPTPLKEWAIRQFGSADKLVLVGSVTLVVLLLAAVAGIVAARRETVGLLIVVGLAGVAGVLAVLRPGAGPFDMVPALVAAVVAATALWWLHRLDDRGAAGSSPEGDGPSRRGVVLATGGLAAAAVGMGALGRWVTSYRLGGTDIALPVATDPAASFPQGLEQTYDGISPLRTPNADFYRVDTRLTVPTVDVESWTLTIDGDVDQEVTLTFDDLAAMSTVERDITLTCVSNEVGGPYVGGARWLGVPLADVLAKAGIDVTKANQILSTDVDGMTISTPLDVALDGRDALIAIGMNGEPLPREHGFPARMVVPGLYGFVSACKWITRMTLTTYDAEQAYWTEREWATDAPIKLSSRIDTPRPLSRSKAGQVVVGGIAWAQGSGIDKVDVRIDGEAWQPAKLGPEVSDDYWRQWYLEWDATPGQHFLAVRATNKDGDVQTDVRMAPFPEGSSGLQEISVTVE